MTLDLPGGPLASLCLLALGAIGGLIWLALRRSDREAAIARRLRAIQQMHDAARLPAAVPAENLLLRLIGRLGRTLAESGLLPARTLADLTMSLSNAGLRGGGGLGLFIGSKIVLLAAMGFGGWLLARQLAVNHMLSIVLPLGGAMLGMLLPDYYLKRMRGRHLKQVQIGLPDALDMMVICSEAGLGLEPAIERVALEIGTAHAAIGEELRITAGELRIIADRRQVLLNMGERTGLSNLQRLAATLIQTTQFGTPLSQALRTLATEMRQEALTRFEARAARLPVFLTVPMIVFILPTIFVIVGGPAALQLAAAFGKK